MQFITWIGFSAPLLLPFRVQLGLRGERFSIPPVIVLQVKWVKYSKVLGYILPTFYRVRVYLLYSL